MLLPRIRGRPILLPMVLLMANGARLGDKVLGSLCGELCRIEHMCDYLPKCWEEGQLRRRWVRRKGWDETLLMLVLKC